MSTSPHTDPRATGFKKALQHFLANPNNASRKRLTQAAKGLYSLTVDLALKENPEKTHFSGDDMSPIMSNIIAKLHLNTLYYSKEKYDLVESLFYDLETTAVTASFAIGLAWMGLTRRTYLSPQEDEIYSLVSQMEAQAELLKKDEHLEEAKIMSHLVENLKNETETFLDLDPDNRELTFNYYKEAMTDIIENGPQVEKLKNFTPWQTSAQNFLAAVSLLGLIYLAATSGKRGSFWMESEKQPAPTLKKMKEALSPKKPQGPGSSAT